LSARSAAEAVEAFKASLQRSLDCITDAVLTVAGGYHPAPHPHVATLNQGERVTLRGPRRLSMVVILHYRIVEAPGRSVWAIRTAAYYFELADARGREFLAYHWHPEGHPISWPHMHVGSGSGADQVALSHKAHLPTGRVSLEDVIHLAITELDVPPRRANWDEILTQARRELLSEV